jgi:hypothetical protein
MLKRATELWQEPLDSNDWQDIHAGHYLFEGKESALREYLTRWAADNPAKLHQLTAEVFGNDPIAGNPHMVRATRTRPPLTN